VLLSVFSKKFAYNYKTYNFTGAEILTVPYFYLTNNEETYTD